MDSFIKIIKHRVTFISLIISVYSTLYGLDTAGISGSVPDIKNRFKPSSTEIEYIMAGTTLGAAGGLIPVMIIGNKWSKKKVLYLASLCYILGFALMAGAQNYAMLMVGRILVGAGHGISCQLVPALIGDLSPKEHRGLMITISALCTNVGMLIGFIVSWGMSLLSSNAWRWTFVAYAVISLVQLPFYYFLIPESPRDLIHSGDISQARRVMSYLNSLTDSIDGSSNGKGSDVYNLNDASFINEEIERIVFVLENEMASTFYDLFNKPDTLKALIIACILHIAKQTTGFSVVLYFSGYLFKVVGPLAKKSKEIPTIIIGCIQVITIGLSTIVIDAVGRKRLLMISAIGMSVGMFALGASFIPITGFTQITKENCADYARCSVCLLDTKCGWNESPGFCVNRGSAIIGGASILNSTISDTCDSVVWTRGEKAGQWIAIVSVMFGLGAFSIGYAGIPWVIQSEIFPQGLKSKAGSIASYANWLSSYIWNVTFLHLSFKITMPGIFWFYAALSIVMLLSVYWILPETKGKNLEDITMKVKGNSSHQSTIVS